MKTIPPQCPEPESGRTYWRSLEQLEGSPEFQQWVEREFPEGASEWKDPVSRRHFVQIMSASFLLAGMGLAGSGCRRPEQRILPFAKMPENYVHGVPQFYATAMPTRGGAIPLVAKSNDGRPTKVEGNALHPDTNGGTDRFAQASILNLYDPDRAMRFTSGGNSKTADAANDFLHSLATKAGSNGGQGVSFLLERNNSPSRQRLLNLVAKKYPQAKWYYDEAVDLDIHRRAATAAFGQSVKPKFNFEAAKVIVSLDCDFLGSEPDVHNNIRGFSEGRRMEKPEDSLNRLYAIESLMTLTGFNADHRLRLASSLIVQAAGALAAQVAASNGGLPGVESIAKPAGVDPKWLSECAKDLLANRGTSLVVAGYRQPLAVHLLAHAMNSALGNIGKTVVFHAVPESKEPGLAELAKSLNAGEVETLVMLGGNPSYTAPVDLKWSDAQAKAKTVVRLGYYEDESYPSRPSDWHFPATHYLESWGDALSSDGTHTAIQPLIAPLFGGMTDLEFLARLADIQTTSPYDIVRETFTAAVPNGDVEGAWRKFLHDGFLAGSTAKAVQVKFSPAGLADAIAAVKVAALSKDNLEVVFYRDYKLDDGRYANNGWLQELPDPVTKITWDNVVLLSRKTAQELGVKNGDVIQVKLGGREVSGPAWVQPGMVDYSLGLALGYGRVKTGRVGQGVGFDVYPLRASTMQNIGVGATASLTGKTYTIACPQNHWSMEGRPIIREANLEQYREHPKFAKMMHQEEPEGAGPMYPNPLDEVKKTGLHQWGMSVDLNRCVGCSACIMACQSENNVPIVGKDQVNRGREMHWLRLDRYYAGDITKRKLTDTFKIESEQQFEDWVDDPQVVTQPMMCQHCESAPCESVCPVNATVHDQEGLNLMVYNRCVGTRYCSNNCPYKVRRFNYFDYNKRPLNALYKGPFGHRKDDEWDMIKMIKNPDVTVRMRGVMEKCTFCIQRIESAKINQKVKAGASGDVVVPTDSFTTACAQACPANAIVFGNINDPESRVSKLKSLDRDYSVLDFLLTKPRLTYLAKVRNPNPQMPDYQSSPRTFQDYKQRMGDPFEHEAAEHEGAAEAHAAGKGEH